MYCPKCGQKYRCPCKACRGDGFEFTPDGDHMSCLSCGLSKHVDWWFNLEQGISKDELK